MSGYAVAHTVAPQSVAAGESTESRSGSDGWPVVLFATARDRLARGALVYRVAEVVALLEQRAAALDVEALESERRREALQVSRDSEAARAPRARAEEMCRVVERVRHLVDGDVPAARALRLDLSIAAATFAKVTDHDHARSQACAEGAAIVERCLIPQCVTWTGGLAAVTEGQLDLLARVMAGVPDVRSSASQHPQQDAGTPAVVRPITREEWRAWLAEDDVRRAPWQQPRGVLLFRPDEVADLLEVEAQLYDQAAERLCATRAYDGDGTALRHLASDLRRELPRVRALGIGDIEAARELLESFRREQRSHTRARRRALWRRSVVHLDVVAEVVEDLLLPLEVAAGGYTRDRGSATEREVYRRWEAGMLDVRDAHTVQA